MFSEAFRGHPAKVEDISGGEARRLQRDDCEPSSLISIVVLSHNRDDVIERNWREMLLSSAGLRPQVVVVYNSSTDGSRAILQTLGEEYDNLDIVLLEENRGVAAGRNAGISRACATVVLSLDDDATISAEAITVALGLFRRMPELGVLAPRVVHSHTGQEQGFIGPDMVEIANFHGAGHFIRREAFFEVGGYDDYCAFGGEELDLSVRMRSQGYRTVFTNRMVVLHSSLVRVGEVGLDRRLKWVRSYAYVFAKNFSLFYAMLLAGRRLASGAIAYGRTEREMSWMSANVGFARVAWEGFRDGRSTAAIVSRETRRFYHNSRLEPEFGNRSLISKAIARQSGSREKR